MTSPQAVDVPSADGLVRKAAEEYARRYGKPPLFAAFAPGRVEIMGNHTDYNGGFVLPAALDRGTVLVGSPSGDPTITLVAMDLGRVSIGSALNPQKDQQNPWADYVLGVVDQLCNSGVPTSGFTAVIHSDLPSGAGLSSSAALEVATAVFIKQLFPYESEPMALARLCQKAENNFVGVNCGILDQFSSVFGQKDSLLFLDCLNLTHDVVKMGRDDIVIVVCDSGVKHALTSGDYNTRRAECMAAASFFGKELLRDVPWDEFLEREQDMPDNLRRRARHVLTEDRRVVSMRVAIQHADDTQIGRLLAQGHASCREQFHNSTPEIDFLVDTAFDIDGCIGAKLTGGGWGGCTVNLVHADAVVPFGQELILRYDRRHAKKAHVYACRAGDGAREIPLRVD